MSQPSRGHTPSGRSSASKPHETSGSPSGTNSRRASGGPSTRPQQQSTTPNNSASTSSSATAALATTATVAGGASSSSTTGSPPPAPPPALTSSSSSSPPRGMPPTLAASTATAAQQQSSSPPQATAATAVASSSSVAAVPPAAATTSASNNSSSSSISNQQQHHHSQQPQQSATASSSSSADAQQQPSTSTATATVSAAPPTAPSCNSGIAPPPPTSSHQQQPPPPATTTATGSGSGSSSQQQLSTTTTTTASASAQPRIRPAIQLTQHLTQTYHEVNEAIYHRKRQEMCGNGPKYNDGYDDAQGHYVFVPGEEIIQRYVVIETLGKGSFGTVMRCYDTKRKEVVAAKITRSGSGFRHQAKLEIDILMKILTYAPDSKIVRILKAFDWKGHLVIVFELLSFNLYQLMQCTNFHGVSLDLTSKFAFQLLMVLRDLERMNPPVIHCDLKPENVLLVNQNRSAIRVIDFGSACFLNRRMFRYIQSRYYRSPEVILGLEYNTAIDRWSLGAILVELHTGVALFDGRNETQQLQRFTGLLGPIPDHMIAASPKRDNFYETVTEEDGSVSYKLKTPPEPHHVRTLPGVLERTQRRRHSATSGSSSSAAAAASSGGAAAAAGATAGAGSGDGSTTDTADRYEQFMDLVRKLLEYDPSKRIGVLPAMEHPFLCEFMPYYLQRTANQQHAAVNVQQTQQSAAAPPGSSSSSASTAAAAASAGGSQQQQQPGGANSGGSGGNSNALAASTTALPTLPVQPPPAGSAPS